MLKWNELYSSYFRNILCNVMFNNQAYMQDQNLKTMNQRESQKNMSSFNESIFLLVISSLFKLLVHVDTVLAALSFDMSDGNSGSSPSRRCRYVLNPVLTYRQIQISTAQRPRVILLKQINYSRRKTCIHVYMNERTYVHV